MLVTEIQRFCMHDGPGLRTTVFLKGCPLRCRWCYNPETQSAKPQILYYEKKCIGCRSCAGCPNGAHSFENGHIFDRSLCRTCGLCVENCPAGALEMCGKEYSASYIAGEAEKDRAFYTDKGGVTVSGGEPFFQYEQLIELLAECRKRGLNTAVETCGYFGDGAEKLKKAVPLTDLFLWDIKDTDSARHKEYTGVPNELIIKNIRTADELGAKIRIRCILVNNVNTNEEHYKKTAALAKSLRGCSGVEFLPYHAYGGTKAEFIGLPDNGVKEWIPSYETINKAKQTVISCGVRVIN